MFRKILHTPDDPLLLVMRVILGFIFFAHGAQKVLGWFGGAGFDQTLKFFTTGLHIPVPLAVLAIMAEFLGGIGLILGLFTRIAAFAIGINMIVAIATVHAPNGLFMNWGGNQRGEGFEYHLLAIGLAILLMARGAGGFSVDRALDHSLAGGVPKPIEPQLSR